MPTQHPCPHTHEPHHSYSEASASGTVFPCDVCDGLIRLCPKTSCGQPNRGSAKYCTQCQTEIPPPTEEYTPTISQGVFIKSLRDKEFNPPYSIKRLAQENIFAWYGTDNGALILTSDKKEPKNPSKLYFIPGFKFYKPIPDIKLLTNTQTLPSYMTWRQAPTVTQQGIFINANGNLYYYISHGGKTLYEGHYWHPDKGKLLWVAADQEGHPLLLIEEDDMLIIYEGNMQLGKWGYSPEKKHPVTPSTHMNGATCTLLSFNIQGKINYCLYDGQHLITYTTHKRSIINKIKVENGATCPAMYENFYKEHYFPAFITYLPDGQARCVLATNRADGEGLSVSILSLDDSSSTKTLPLNHPIDWVKPSKNQKIYFVNELYGDFKAFIGHVPIDGLNRPGTGESSIQLVEDDNWILVQATPGETERKEHTRLWFASYNNGEKPDGKSGEIANATGKMGLQPLFHDKTLYLLLDYSKNGGKKEPYVFILTSLTE